MNGQQITSAMRAAFPVARAALTQPSTFGPADTVVIALGFEQLLQSPETVATLDRLQRERAALNGVLAGADLERGLLQARVAELIEELAAAHGEQRRLRARVEELAPYEVLYPQFCEGGQHRPWFADSPGPVACPWCAIAHLQAGAGQVFRVERDAVGVAAYATLQAAGAHCEAVVRARIPGAVCEWVERPDASGVLDLVTRHSSHTGKTGLSVVMVEVLPEHVPAVTG